MFRSMLIFVCAFGLKDWSRFRLLCFFSPLRGAQGHHELTWCARRSPSAAYVSSRELGCRRRLNCVGVAKPVWGSLDGNPGRPARQPAEVGPCPILRGRPGAPAPPVLRGWAEGETCRAVHCTWSTEGLACKAPGVRVLSDVSSGSDEGMSCLGNEGG